jgi:hypothetical protein
MKKLLLCAVIGCLVLHAKVDPLEGLWQGYGGEWNHVSRQLVALAEAIPADKYGWRPGRGVRSTSEVLMHIALADFYLLSVTGPPMPAEIKSVSMEKTVTAKPEVIAWLKRSLEAGQERSRGYQAERPSAAGQGGGPGCDGGWHVSADDRSRE